MEVNFKRKYFMVPINLKFSYFTTKNKYLKLQELFLNYCKKEGYPGLELKELKPNDFKIIYKDDEKYTEVTFDEFLKSQIPHLKNNILTNIIRKVKKTDIIKGDELSRFVDIRLKSLDKIEKKIKHNDSIDGDVKELLFKSLKEINAKLVSQEFESLFILDKRIKLNWYKNDFLVLLSLLRENGHISLDNTTTELGLAVDQVFAFKNSKTDEYQNYKGSGKKINDLINGNGSPKRSLKRLKDIFSNEEFYLKI